MATAMTAAITMPERAAAEMLPRRRRSWVLSPEVGAILFFFVLVLVFCLAMGTNEEESKEGGVNNITYGEDVAWVVRRKMNRGMESLCEERR